jgi:hypothetical protein
MSFPAAHLSCYRAPPFRAAAPCHYRAMLPAPSRHAASAAEVRFSSPRDVDSAHEIRRSTHFDAW